MAKFKVAGVTVIRVSDPTTTATMRNMTQYIDAASSVGGKVIIPLEVTSFADAAERFIAGIETSQEFTFSGFFDDTATTGPDIVFGPVNGSLGTVEFNPVGTAVGARKYLTQALVTSYKITGAVKERVGYEVVYKQDGAMTTTAN